MNMSFSGQNLYFRDNIFEGFEKKIKQDTR